MAWVKCANESCERAGVVLENKVTMFPGESVICGTCGQPCVDAEPPEVVPQ